MTGRSFLILPVIGVVCLFAGGFWLATQSVAKALNYSQGLGPHLFMFGKTPIYAPKFLYWYWLFGNRVPDIFDKASNMIYLSAVSSIIFVVLCAMYRARKKKTPTSHGSARWANRKEIEQSGLLGKTMGGEKVQDGVVLGLTEEGEYLRHDGPEHCLVVAPTRSGKGVGLIIPTLLSWPHSTLVTDIKSENWQITAGYRKAVLNNKVLKFEPTANDNSSVRFNPLAEIRAGSEFEVEDTQNIVEMLVNPGSGEKLDNDHWKLTAGAFLVGVILHLKYKQVNASLPSLASYLKEIPLDSILEEMISFEHTQDINLFTNIYGQAVLQDNPLTHPIVYREGMKMISTPEKEEEVFTPRRYPVFGCTQTPLSVRISQSANLLFRT